MYHSQNIGSLWRGVSFRLFTVHQVALDGENHSYFWEDRVAETINQISNCLISAEIAASQFFTKEFQSTEKCWNNSREIVWNNVYILISQYNFKSGLIVLSVPKRCICKQQFIQFSIFWNYIKDFIWNSKPEFPLLQMTQSIAYHWHAHYWLSEFYVFLAICANFLMDAS